MKEEYLNFMETLLKDDFSKYLDSLKQLPRKSIHLNTTLVKKQAILGDFLKEPIPFDETSYFIDEEKPGRSIFHTLGLYYVQEASAMMPVLATSIPKDAKILDLCAAPGGKTLQLANLAPDGIIYANETNPQRVKKLASNIERLGLKNVVITQMTSKELKKCFEDYFDYILVDAPCSLEGTFRKDPLAISLWSKNRVQEMSCLQKELILDASYMLKKKGKLIYSTCTFSKEENEEVVKFLMEHTSMKLLDVNPKLLPYTKAGCTEYGNDYAKTRRGYPFLIGEGQYFAVLERQDGSLKNINNALEKLSYQEELLFMNELKNTLTHIPFVIRKYHSQIVAIPKDTLFIPFLKTYMCFVNIGKIQKGRVIFHHQFARCYGTFFKNQVHLLKNDDCLSAYLNGQEIQKEVPNGWGVIMVEGYPLGLYKASNHQLKNHYPKGLRNDSKR